MTINTLHLDRPLTKAMIETLMEAHERFLMNLSPLDATVAVSGKGLISREMMEMKPITTDTGKKIFSLFITNKGMEYLNKIKK